MFCEYFYKFFLLLWKNWLIQYRHKTQTIFQLIIPILFILNLIYIRGLEKPETELEKTTHEFVKIEKKIPLNELEVVKPKEWKVVYSPKNAKLDELMTEAAADLSLTFEGVKTPEEVEKIVIQRDLFAGVLFHFHPNITRLPKVFSYTLRFPSEMRLYNMSNPRKYNWQTNMLFPRFSGGGPRGGTADNGSSPHYFNEGFLQLQCAITHQALKMKCLQMGHEKPDDRCKMYEYTDIHRFPYPPYTNDVVLDGLEAGSALFIVLAFLYPIINIVRFIAIEKEKQLKDMMTIMGTPVWLNWASWFTHSMTFMIIVISCIVTIVKVPVYDPSISVFTHSNWFTIWMFLFIYSIAITIYCFLMSVLFSKANTAAAVAGILWFMSYMPYYFMYDKFICYKQNRTDSSIAMKIVASILPNVAMAFGFKQIISLERNDDGLQWSNWTETEDTTGLSLRGTICCMLISSILYSICVVYIEKVCPDDYRLSQKISLGFYRCLSFSNEKHRPLFRNFDFDSKLDETNFEPEPRYCERTVQAKNLWKVYDNGQVACRRFTFNLLRDQITVLLGNNGSGKSTIVKMLIGMTEPTFGSATVNGYDIRKDLRKARKSIGVCLQRDILFDELTVGEHIAFYSRMKGLRGDAVKNEVNKYVQLLNLEPKINSISKSLSGGMKRKLSFAIALCGDSKVIFCEEPTSGMDPTARRELWDLIQKEKIGRTILLTTHFMDEADVLADRIAIVADGELKCNGTPFYLKQRFGSKYKLTCVKKHDCDSSAVTNLLREYVPDLEILDEFDGTISYSLPHEYPGKFSKLFENLENKLETLKLHRFGISTTELEEVFLKVSSEDETPDSQTSQTDDSETESEASSEVNDLPKYESLQGFRLLVNQIYAMFKKRFYCLLNNWHLILMVNILKIMLVLAAVHTVRRAKCLNLPSLEMSLDTYGPNVALLQEKGYLWNRTMSAVRRIMSETKGSSYIRHDEDNVDMFLRFGKVIKSRTNTRHLFGISYRDDLLLEAWFNNQLIHTPSIALNVAHNTRVRAMCANDHRIRVFNWPLPFKPESKLQMTINGNDMGSELARELSLEMAFIFAFYAIFYIRERSSKAKLLQFISGVGAFTFWITSFLFDFVSIILSDIVLVIIIAIYNEEHWATFEELTPVFVVLIVFGFAVLGIVFVSSFVFTDAANGFICLFTIFILTGLNFYHLLEIMTLPVFDLQETIDFWDSIFIIFPHFALASSLLNINRFRIGREKCKLEVKKQMYMQDRSIGSIPSSINSTDFCDTNVYSWNEPGIGRHLTYMSLVALTFYVILIIIESGLLSKITYYFQSISKPKRRWPFVLKSHDIDIGVRNEKDRVKAMTPFDLQNNKLVVRNLTKSYANYVVVKKMNFAINSSECFGLLGSNGAGKTSTFKMMTGDTKISGGDVFVNGKSVKNNLTEVRKMIGYCPQFDALLKDLTGSQTLEIFGLIHGYRRKDISIMSARLAHSLNFNDYIHKMIDDYSGGNKRKLSTAIALMGNPDVIYLDEPSSRMDPSAKRILWNVLTEVRNSGSSIVLTSHSMEECEAICTRMAIMVRGEFKCIGSAQYLKDKSPTGYLLTTKIRSKTALIHFNHFIRKHFPGSYMKEKSRKLRIFYIPKTKDVKWSALFNYMERAKATVGVIDYSICQASLEQVFLSLTKKYDDFDSSDESSF